MGSGSRQRPSRPKLVLVGSAHQSWNGFDKLVNLAERLPEAEFVCIGNEIEGPSNLESYSYLPHGEVVAIMRDCTVGIGPLALHRKKMEEASPLKSRTYLSLGLPVIQAYSDTDLTENDGCILQIPNTPDNTAASLDRIRTFTGEAFQDSALSDKALSLARGRLSLEAKEKTRLAFFEQAVALN